jgi:hypothetical protein
MSLESPILRDGDAGFLGFASRLNPVTLPAGMLQDSVNMRLDRGVATTRKGSKRLTDTIGTTGAPLTLDFTLGTDKTVTSITRASTTATVTATAHGFTTGDQINIRGADQTDYNGDFLVTVTDANTFTYTVSGSPATPATGTIIANNGPEVRDSYDGGLYAATVFASQNYDNASEYIAMAGSDSVTLWKQGASPVVKSFPSSPNERIEATDTVSMLQAYDRLYVFREAAQTGNYAGKLTNSSGITVSSTTATVNVDAHAYPEGATVRIEGSTTTAFDGHEFRVLGTNLNTNSFEITVPSGTATHAAAGIKVRRVKPPLYWDGGSGNFVRASAGVPSEGPTYTKMPSVGWAAYINNRLYLARNRDTVAISDILDPDIYDPFWNSFRAGAGGDDRIVAIHPWVEGQVLVFCRKSIWLATIGQFSSTDGSGFSIDTPVTSLVQLTNEIGCSARNTIVTAGQFVFFLSDAGIYRLDSRLDLKLRGDTTPLSEPIADLFATVVQSRVEKVAFALWHNNRYLIALPTSTEPLDGNQLVLAWNSLNQQWEYRDIYPASAAINQIMVATYDSQRRIFSIPRTGNLYLLEENTNARDDNAANGGTSLVSGRIKTRRYGMGSMQTKRFVRSLADVVLPDTAGVTVKAITINPDNEITLVQGQTNTSGLSEDYTLKQPIRAKSHYCELQFETTANRPEIRNVSIEAAGQSLPPTETRNAA